MPVPADHVSFRSYRRSLHRLTYSGVHALILIATAYTASVAQSQTSYVPMQFRTVSGIRPFVNVKMNGTEFLLMLHANAKLFVMTNHANATSIQVSIPEAHTAYGIEQTGKVSSLGRAAATLGTLEVGGVTSHNVSLQVFETPQDPPMEGMLGIDWILAAHPIVDYDQATVGLPADLTDSRRDDDSIRRRGYRAHSMVWDADASTYYVWGWLNGVRIRFNVGTVSNNIVDVTFARKIGIALGPVVGEAGGPKGAVEPQFVTKRQVSIQVGNQMTAPSQPLVWNVAGYDSEAQATRQATLGAEFMLANRAVIDFGTKTLFLPEDLASPRPRMRHLRGR